ncbi:MAG: DNA polymerase III subunit beta [Synergistes sp.]|nr:DNA polymerase III subunit beta [Synergistes sp.]
MKLSVIKKLFLTSWNLAERNTNLSSKLDKDILSSVFIKANKDKVVLLATDSKTALRCTAEGVTVLEEGSEILPVNKLSELFKKAPSDEFMIDVRNGKIVIKAGKGVYRFSSYAAGEYPEFPSADNAEKFCTISSAELSRILEEGTICASLGDDYPLYLSSVNFEIKDNMLRIASTDGFRVAASSACAECFAESGTQEPATMKGVKELQKILSTLDAASPVEILHNDKLFFFRSENIEFSLLRVETKFPNYEKIMPTESTLAVTVDRSMLADVLERVDVVVKDFTHQALICIDGDSTMTLYGKAPDIGTVKDEISVKAEGEPLNIAVNARYLLDAVRVVREPDLKIWFNGSKDKMLISRCENKDFFCMIAPMNISEAEIAKYKSEPKDGEDAF